jgi:hypothetical protein
LDFGLIGIFLAMRAERRIWYDISLKDNRQIRFGALHTSSTGSLMSNVHRALMATAVLACGLTGSPRAQEGGGVMITIRNDTTDNLLVTVYDMGASPRQQVLSDRPLYGNASLTVSITQDASGKGHLWWRAMSLDRDMRQCGHDDTADLNDGDTVNVSAGDDCGG